jgi:amino acid transporter
MSVTTAQGEFRRELGWFSLLTMSLGTVIGSGWLILPSVVAAKAGPASVLCWVFAGLCMLIVALVYAELGAAWPATGAVALYPRLSHGAFTAHLSGWAAFISYAVIPPADVVAVTRYAAQFLPSLMSGAGLSLLGLTMAIGILALIGLLNYAGVRYLSVFQNWVTSAKYVPIVLFVVVVGIFAFHPGNFAHHGGFAPTGASGFMLGTASTLFAYLGFRQALDFGGEAQNPGRDMPRAIILTMVLAIATYTLIALVFVGGIDWTALARYGVRDSDWASLTSLPAPVYDVTAAAGIGYVAWLILADGLISPNGPNATAVGSVPRVAYTLAENGAMPRLFLNLGAEQGTPGWGLFVCFLLEVFFLLITAGGYGELVEVISVAFMVAYALGPVSFAVLRETQKHTERPFHLPGGAVMAPVAFVLASLLLYWSKWPRTGETLGILLIGAIIYFGYAAVGRVPWRSVQHGLWLVVYLVVMAGLSYLGDTAFGGIGVLPMGWDILAVAVSSLAIFRWAVRQGIEYGG